MYTDSHCHLNYLSVENYQNNPQNLITALKHAQISRVMAIMCRFDEFDEIENWTKLSDDEINIGMSMGIHPCQDIDVLTSVTAEKLMSFNNENVWAFGETGLDYYWDADKKSAQKSSFIAHIQAGKIAKKPIIVHTRNAYQDTLDLLTTQKCEHGIIHCFTEDYDFARKALDLGLYISLSGIVTFKKSQDLQAVVKKLPLDRILIETDSPYLAPVPKRGKENSPAYVPYVAEFLGKIFGKTGEEIGQITSKNFTNLLNQYL